MFSLGPLTAMMLTPHREGLDVWALRCYAMCTSACQLDRHLEVARRGSILRVGLSVLFALAPPAPSRDRGGLASVRRAQRTNSSRVWSQLGGFGAPCRSWLPRAVRPDRLSGWSWSLSWVSSTAPLRQVPGQHLGRLREGAVAGTGSCPYNGAVSYHWYSGRRAERSMWSRLQLRSGAPEERRPWSLRLRRDRRAHGNYHFYINEVSQYAKAGYTIDDCWGGVASSPSNGRTRCLDPNDQNGGTVSNHQQFFERPIQGWIWMALTRNRRARRRCARVKHASWHCGSGSSGNFFNEWTNGRRECSTRRPVCSL